MLIASTKPLVAMFHHGYLRLSMNEFDNEDNNLITHLTNQVSKFVLSHLFRNLFYEFLIFFFQVFPKKRSTV
jgi:hypothetical protein